MDRSAEVQALETGLVSTDEGFRRLEREWSELYAGATPRNPFLSFEWTRACRTHLCPRAGLFILTARENGRLVGVAPLRVDRTRGFRVLRFISSGWSEYGGFLRAPDCAGVEAALLQEAQRREGEWDLLMLRQLAVEFTQVPSVISGAVSRATTFESEGSPHLACAGDWEELCARGPHWLKQVQRRVRRFAREGGTLDRYFGAEAAERMSEVAAVERRSWQGKYGQPVFQDARIQAMFRQCFEELAPRREMELWLARVEGQAVAYEINLLTPERVWLYRGAYDQNYARLGPGGVLEFHSIREAWREGRREYDYLSGLEPYKAERTNAVRPLQVVAAHPGTPRGYAAAACVVPVRWRLERFHLTRGALSFLAELKRCPKATLPGKRVLRSRVR